MYSVEVWDPQPRMFQEMDGKCHLIRINQIRMRRCILINKNSKEGAWW